MKKLALVAVALLIFGCDIMPLKNKGNISVKNGKGESTSIPYECKGCAEYIQQSSEFKYIVENITEEAKNNLNFPLSFIPLELDIEVSPVENRYYYDSGEEVKNAFSIKYYYKYIGKNAYNAEIEGRSDGIVYCVNNYITDLMKDIRLDSLYLVDSNNNYKTINRKLILTNKDDYIIIYALIKSKDISLIIDSSYSCVDEGATLAFTFKDNSRLEIYSNNDFNCEGKMYFFNITKDQINKLKNNNIARLSTYYKESMLFNIQDNESDYFMQLMSLIE